MVGLFSLYFFPILVSLLPWICISTILHGAIESYNYLQKQHAKLGNISYDVKKKIRIWSYLSLLFYSFTIFISFLLSLFVKHPVLRIFDIVVSLILAFAFCYYRIKSRKYKNLYAMYENGVALFDSIFLWDDLSICFINHLNKLEIQSSSGIRLEYELSQPAIEWFKNNVIEKR